MTMRMQVAFRAASEKSHGRNTYMVAGVLAHPLVSQLRPETIAAMSVIGSSTIEAVRFEAAYRPDEHNKLDLAASGLGSLVTRRMWELPRVGDVLQIFLRDTLIEPPVDDHEVYAFSGLLVVDPDMVVDCDAIYCFDGAAGTLAYAGKLGVDIRPEWGSPGMVERTRGCQLDSFLHEPLWGFGDEAVGLRSTMRLDVNSLVDRHSMLWILETPTPQQAREVEELERQLHPQGLGRGFRDDNFKAAMKVYHQRFPDLVTRSSSTPVTRSLIAEFDEAMRAAIAESIGPDVEFQSGP